MNIPALRSPSVDHAPFSDATHIGASRAPNEHRARQKDREDDFFYEGPGLHDPVAAGSASWASQAAHYFTLYGSPPDSAQHPWGLQVAPPRGARAGIVGLSSGEVPGSVQMHVMEGWHIGLQANRFVYIVGVLLSAYWFVSLTSWMGRLGIVLTTNVALGVAFDRRVSWRATVSEKEALKLLRRDAQILRRIMRFVGIGTPSRYWLLPPGQEPLHERLREPGDEIAFFRQRAMGAGLSLMSWMFVNRVGPSGALSTERSARFTIDDEEQLTAEFSLYGRTTSSVARSDSMFWAGSHEGMGDSRKTTWVGEAPFASERARTLSSLAWNSFVAGYVANDIKARPAAYGFSKSEMHQQVLSAGYGFHFPWSLPWLKGVGVGAVFEHGIETRERNVFGGRALSEKSLILRGLDESMTGGRRRWSLTLTLPQKEAPLGCSALKGRLECKHEIDWLTATDGQQWREEMDELFRTLSELPRSQGGGSILVPRQNCTHLHTFEQKIYAAFACDLLFDDLAGLTPTSNSRLPDTLKHRMRFSFGEIWHGAKQLLRSRSRNRNVSLLREQVDRLTHHFDLLSSPDTLDVLSAWGPRALPHLRDIFKKHIEAVELRLVSESVETLLLDAEKMSLGSRNQPQAHSKAKGSSSERDLIRNLDFWTQFENLPTALASAQDDICRRLSCALEVIRQDDRIVPAP